MDSYKGLTNLASCIVGSKSPFTNQGSTQKMTPGQFVLFYIILLLLILVINYIGSVLFNMSVVKIMPSIKQIDTLHFFILNIVLHMLFC